MAKDIERSGFKRGKIFSCGPTPARGSRKVAKHFNVACQVSLEEYRPAPLAAAPDAQARATPTGPTMKRVCVDGPVFEASAVFQRRNYYRHR